MSAAVWDMDRVRQVRSLVTRMTINHEALIADRLTDTKIISHLFRELTRMQYGIAEGIRKQDCEISRHEKQRSIAHVFSMRWAPSTKAIELVHGPADGTLIAFQGAPSESFILPVNDYAPFRQEADMDRPMPLKSVEYTLGGWHTENNHWIYIMRRTHQ